MKRLLLAVMLVSACSRSPDAAWPAGVIETHLRADQMIDSGDLPAARRLLGRLATAVPAGAPDTRRVIAQDARFRLARLALQEHDPAAAAREAEAGLALGHEATLFVANLLVVHGAAQEALGHAAAAVDDYQHALRINEKLLGEVTAPP